MTEFNYKTENGLNYITIDNALNDKEINLFWNPFSYFKPHFGDGTTTGTARDSRGRPLKKNKGIFITEARPMPLIYDTFNRLLFNNLSHMFTEGHLPSDSTYASSSRLNWDGHLLQYYDTDEEGYQSDQDSSIFSAVFFFYKEPKNFTGGDFYFSDYDVTVEIKNNTGVVFPSHVQHCATPVTITDKNIQDGGRVSYSIFTGLGRESE